MKKKKNYNFLFYILLIISLLGIAYSSYKIFKWSEDNKNTEKETEKIVNETVVNETETDDNITLINPDNESKESIYWSYVKMNMIDVNIEELKQKNSDTKGWIQLSGTNINYPFVQANNNSYYLNHSFEKKYTDAGWIFLDYRNDINNLSKNNVIYGHARLDKTMFGTLKKVLTKDWYNNKDNHVIRLSTSEYNSLWQIFSVYSIKTESYYITTDFKDNDEFQKFIDTVKGRSKYKFDANVTTDDNILTLSTCHNTNDKIVVHAKLIVKSKKHS